jgi:UDP-N-acetylglucosamine 2-epimerase (non-hydrolysing)
MAKREGANPTFVGFEPSLGSIAAVTVTVPVMGSVVFVAGARPNFMKVAPILRELAHRNGPLTSELVHTGQHYDFDMSGVFFDQLGIPTPNVHLQVGSASHGVQSGRIMVAFDEYLAARTEAPHTVVVVGDVNSTMACALVAVKRSVRVVHVEAGLRSFDRAMPEEVNRLVTDAVSHLLLVSEPAGLENLAREGIPDDKVRYVGNVMIDTLVDQLAAARELAMPARFALDAKPYAVVTLHRPSNVDVPGRLAQLASFLRELGAKLHVVFPVHPRTEKRLNELGLRDELVASGRVQLTAPLGYREFLGLMAASKLVVTDSGGIQEETTFLRIPCVTLRSNTERPVTVSAGTNTLVGDDLAAAMRVVDAALTCVPKQLESIRGWDGRAASRVVDALYE